MQTQIVVVMIIMQWRSVLSNIPKLWISAANQNHHLNPNSCCDDNHAMALVFEQHPQPWISAANQKSSCKPK
jgi:hypothetical protein